MVLPIIIGAAVLGALVIGQLITRYRQPPQEENPTIREQEERLEMEEEEERNEREEENKRKKEQQNYLQALLQEAKESLQRERAKSKELAEKQQREGMKEDEAVKEAERVAEREKELEREIKIMKENERQFEEEIKAAKEDAERERALRHDIENKHQLIKWPTREEFDRGRDLIQYNKKNLHFAIVGKSGSGKSSLINGFIDRSSNEPGAAATGVTETTSTIGRYPDPGTQEPRPWTVWYDVPGAGTQNVSAWQYFINQGLFVFDIIFITIGDRFEETDVQLLRDCHRFKIPALIVRSKADMHIDNLVKEKGGWGQHLYQKTYKQCRKTFITASRQMVRDELQKAGLEDQEVYLVSSYTLRAVYNRALEDSEDNLPFDMIDEQKLVQAMMFMTIQRRCGNDPVLRTEIEALLRVVHILPAK